MRSHAGRLLQGLLRSGPILVLLAGCVAGNVAPRVPSVPERPQSAMVPVLERVAGDSSQVVVAAGAATSGFDARVYAFEKGAGGWHEVSPPVKAVIGRNGFALPGRKREGDGMTPTGVFPLGPAFGYEPTMATRMDYRQATERDIWVDDPDSPDYNRWVSKGATTAASFEEMRRSDNLYRYGLVIGYNTSPVVRGLGSAIFFHVWRGEGMPTSGCVGLPEESMVRILGWLDPARKPLAILGIPDDYGAMPASPAASADMQQRSLQ